MLLCDLFSEFLKYQNILELKLILRYPLDIGKLLNCYLMQIKNDFSYFENMNKECIGTFTIVFSLRFLLLYTL